jgi:glycine/sarcosine N-methyltransferase
MSCPRRSWIFSNKTFSNTSADGFYDLFAAHYHLLWEDWEASITRQAVAIATILERESVAAGATVLDCACGIGTQALGLAKLGFRITGADVSEGAVHRARSEAATRKLDLPFHVADMRNLNDVPASGFHAVICMDNALPHLLSESDLAQAAVEIRTKLRAGGMFVASIRDYDEILPRRPLVHGPHFFSDEGKRRIVFQVWDWQDERRYKFHMYLTRETSVGWTTLYGTSSYRAVLRQEITAILQSHAFTNVRWLFPGETGYHQPVVIATAEAYIH